MGQVDPDRTVATINGTPIKGAEYYRRMEFLPGVGKLMGKSFAEFPPGFLTLDRLFTEKLVTQLAKARGVYPSDLEVAAELKARIQDDPNLLTNWKASGQTEAELNEQIRYELSQFKLATFGVTITDQEVTKFYNEHPTMYTTPKQVKLRVVVVDDPNEKKAVEGELSAGKPFADVAKAHSIDVGRERGGEFGTVPVTVFSDQMSKAIGETKIGQTTPWLQTKSGESTNYVKFLIEDVIPEKLSPLNDHLKRAIRRQLLTDKGKAKNNLEQEMVEMRKKAKIEISDPAFADVYKKYSDEYLKEKGG